MSSEKFEEQQPFRQRGMYFIYFLILALLSLFIYASVKQIGLGQPFGEKPGPNYILIVISLFILTLLIVLYKAKLQTLITDEGISLRWRPFQNAYRKFRWSDIDKVEIISYGFVGYGLRLTPYGTVHNVAGDTGIRLHLKSGKKVVLGTQKPNELADFLRKINHLD